MDEQKVIDKIQKLLALATSSNIHEANLATERAHTLMQRHNLSLSQIDIDAHTKSNVGETLYSGSKLRSHDWIFTLANGCAALFDARIVIARRPKRQIFFVGFPADIAAASALFTHLHDSWHNIATADMTSIKLIHPTWDKSQSLQFMKAHGINYALAIKTRCTDLVAARETTPTHPTSNSLVVVKSGALKDYMQKYTSGRGSNLSHQSALGAQFGTRAGNSAALGGAISQSSPKRIT